MRELTHPLIDETWEYSEYGYGYSWGAGFGYETGNGLRFDGTIDSVETTGLKITKDVGDPNDGDYTLMLRSTVALANVYYDFGLGGDWGYSAGSGGAFGYVGAGVGVAWNHAEVNALDRLPGADRHHYRRRRRASWSVSATTWATGSPMWAIAASSIDQINNDPTADPDNYYEANSNWIHELRGTVRYRFN